MATATENPNEPTPQTEVSLSVLLLLLVVTIFVVPVLGLPLRFDHLYRDLSFSVLLGCLIVVAWKKTAFFFAGISLFGLTFLVRWAVWLLPAGTLGIWPEALTMLALLMTLYVLLALVFAPGHVTHYRIQGAIAAYLLFGVVFANAYALIVFLDPGSFQITTGPRSDISNWFYFSFVTLTTVGYGDIVPVHQVARVLAMAEALTGQLYLAVLLAHLVSMRISHAAEEKQSKSSVSPAARPDR